MKLPFRGFSAILFKEFLVVLRDPLTLFFMLFPPLVEMIAGAFISEALAVRPYRHPERSTYSCAVEGSCLEPR